MKPGQTLVYSWSVNAPPEEFYTDFHSEMRPAPKETVISHKAAVGVSGNGAMVAPFDGIHGWYLQNQSEKPVVVHLKLSGFYELLPDGKPPRLRPAPAGPQRRLAALRRRSARGSAGRVSSVR